MTEMVDWALAAMQNLRALVDDMLKVRLIEESLEELAARIGGAGGRRANGVNVHTTGDGRGGGGGA